MRTFKRYLNEKKLTKAELKKREEVAKAIERDNPGMPMDKKMAIATSTAKRVAESSTDKWYKNQPEWGTPESTKLAKKITPGQNEWVAPLAVGAARLAAPAVVGAAKYVGKKLAKGAIKGVGNLAKGAVKTAIKAPVKTLGKVALGTAALSALSNRDKEKKKETNEVSADTLKDYIRKAAMDKATRDYVGGFEHGQKQLGIKRPDDPKNKLKSRNRLGGIITAADKLARKANKKDHNEDMFVNFKNYKPKKNRG